MTGAVSGPINDQLRGRLAGEYKQTDGWMTNPVGRDSEPGREAWSLRGSLEWDVNDNSQLYLKVEGFDTEMNGRSNQLVSPPVPVRRVSRRIPMRNSERDSRPPGEHGHRDRRLRRLQLPGGNRPVRHGSRRAHPVHHRRLLGSGIRELSGRGRRTGELPEHHSSPRTTTSSHWKCACLSPTGNTFEYIAGVALPHQRHRGRRQHSPFGFFPAFLDADPGGQ